MLNVLTYTNPDFQPGVLNVWPHQAQTKQDLIQAMVAHRQGRSTRLNARSCALIQPTPSEARAFMEANHLAGSTNSSYRFGLLHHEHGLVFLITIGKARFTKDADLEVLRLATKAGFSVAGGASRLFAHIQKELTGTLLSYSDNLIGDGTVYERCGFTDMGSTGAGYFWEKNGQVLHRYATQKHRLIELLGDSIDLSKSERQLMMEAGWVHVPDRGNRRWVLELQHKVPDPQRALRFHFTYRTTRPSIDGAYYLGVHSTDTVEDGYIGSGMRLNASIAKYGREVHQREVIKLYQTRAEAMKAERVLVDAEALADPLCMNLTLGGQTPFSTNGPTNGCRWMHHLESGKELPIPSRYMELLLRRGWSKGRHPDTKWCRGTWWIDANGKQKRGSPPEGAKLGRLNGTTTGRTWVERGEKQQLVEEVLPSDTPGFKQRSTNKGKKKVMVGGVQRVVSVDHAEGLEKLPGPNEGKIGMRSPEGTKRVVDPIRARELVKLGWTIATTQLKSAPPQVLELAAELGMKLPKKRAKKQ